MGGPGVDVREVVHAMLSETHVVRPARIDAYDRDNQRADVELLARDETDRAPIIVDCPVATFRAGGIVLTPPYQTGDEVLLVFSDESLESQLHDGTPRDVEINRRHALDDAVVIHGLVDHSTTLSVGGSAAAACLAIEGTDQYVQLAPSGEAEVNVDTAIIDADRVELGSGSLEALVQESVKDALNSHTHPGDSGGTTGPPNQQIITGSDVTTETEAS